MLAQFIVETIADNGDDTTPTDKSLRWAIKRANEDAVLDTIKFDLGAGEHTIALPANTQPLPKITTGPVVIDGTPLDGKPAHTIILDGRGALGPGGTGVNGLVLEGQAANGSTIKGLRIIRYTNPGIAVIDSSSNTIGGKTPQERNVISNNSIGISFEAGANQNTVIGNYIGTSPDGKSASANVNGISIDGSHSNIIGGLDLSERNVISGNTVTGVEIGSGGTGNTIAGNYIGTNPAGTDPVPNAFGVRVFTADPINGNTIGAQLALVDGVIQTPANVISGNKWGIVLNGAKNVKVWGNFIGTDFNGENKLSNTRAGIDIIQGGTNNWIGGPLVGMRNVISGNGDFTNDTGSGVQTNSNKNLIQNNNIGTGKDRANKALNLGNAEHGVNLYISIGMEPVGNEVKTNQIAWNKQRGVRDSTDKKNKVYDDNSIFSNGNNEVGLGIDVGPSGLTRDGMPVLTSVVSDNNNLIVQGQLSSTPNTMFSIELFHNGQCDPSGYGEGDTQIHAFTVTTDSAGNVSFAVLFSPKAVPLSLVNNVTASATSLAIGGGTSEFSRCIRVYGPNSIGDFVWEDLNANGTWDPYELGLAGVTVNLYDGSGNFVGTNTTDASGHYLFSGLGPGEYSIGFAAPGGYFFSPRDVGTDDTIDSDPDLVTGRTATFTLGAGGSNPNIDAGLYRKGIVGNFVWDDLNGNGLLDQNEPGMSNVLVRLYDKQGMVVTSAFTDSSGYYVFCVQPGNYFVEFVPANNYVFTVPNNGTDDTIDSDANPVTGRTDPFNVTSGQTDNTRDAGLFLSDQPELNGMGQTFGPTSGGTTVLLTGRNFLGASQVLFGSTPAAFTVNSPTQITATAPAQAASTVDVTVSNASGSSAATPAGWFTYVTTPIRTLPGFRTSTLPAGIDGFAGPVDLGFTLNFFGRLFSQVYVNDNGNVTFGAEFSGNYSPFALGASPLPIVTPFWADVDTRVGPVVSYGRDTLGGRPAFAVNWVTVGYASRHVDRTNLFQLVIIDRSDIAPGAFDIEFNYSRVTWETGDSSGGSNGLGGLSARVGYSNGTGGAGTFLELNGSGVNGAFLDSNAATGLIHNSLSSGGVLGRYVFQIRSGGGAAALSSGGTTAPAVPAAPTVRGVRSSAGPTTGGIAVTLLGSGFSGVTGVFFGDTPVPSFVVQSPDRIVATAPARAAGLVNVRVVSAAGASLPTAASRFAYVPAPAVTGVSSAVGPTRGGATVVLTGVNFVEASQVLFGSTPARSFEVLSPTQIRVVTPPRLPGQVDVRVVAAGGTSPLASIARYTYVAAPRVTALSQTAGPMTGGIVLTLTGANFTGATAVLFGTTRAAVFTVLSPTQIRVTVPARPAGTVDVRVVTAGGGSPTSPAARFTYTAGMTAASTAAPVSPGGSDDEPLVAADVDLVMTLLYDSEDERDFAPTAAP